MTNEEIWREFKYALGRDVNHTIGKNIQSEIERAFKVKNVDVNNSTWDILIETINYGLISWLVTNNQKLKKKFDIDKARQALCVPDNKQYIKFWSDDIRRLYMPVAREIALDLE